MKPISNDIREKIMAEVKLGQRPVAQIAESHGVKPNTVYGWVSKGVTKSSDVMEIHRLQRKILELYEIIGKLTEGLERLKKN
jgi:transposase-like protein